MANARNTTAGRAAETRAAGDAAIIGGASAVADTAPPTPVLDADRLAVERDAPIADAVTLADVARAEAGFVAANERRGFLLVICRLPGFRRAGIAHPARAEYPLDAFTAEQLTALRNEPQIEVIEVDGQAIPREHFIYGDPAPVHRAHAASKEDKLLAGRAAAAAVSHAPDRTEPGLRGRAADYQAHEGGARDGLTGRGID